MRNAILLALLGALGCGAETASQVVGTTADVCLGPPCSADTDCAGNARCNLKLEQPRCMLLRCSQAGEACDDRLGAALCEPLLACDFGVCLAGGARDWPGDPCPATESCKVFGKCTTLQGFCQSWDDADCAGSDECALSGECKAGDLIRDITKAAQKRIHHRTCWPAAPCDTGLGTDQVNACAEVGLCTDVDGRCLATSAEKCAASEACVGTGACDVKDGECWRAVTDDAQCATGARDDDVCASFGFCQVVDGACNAVTDAHCAGSYLCQTWGECYAWDGECWARPGA